VPIGCGRRSPLAKIPSQPLNIDGGSFPPAHNDRPS
jgi:hypothetical protein